MIDVYDKTQMILKKYKIQADKSLGQNFLIDENVINSIIDSAELSKEDLIIEIGPGLGVLTNGLLEKANKVIAVELDERMVKILSDRFQFYNNLTIINDDILKVDLNKIIKQEKQNTSIKKVKVVANLPYYISTPIIMKLLEQQLDINEIIVMVQKEVADRLIAIPGTKLSGAITYAVDYYSKTEKVIDVDKSCFIPKPKVNSEVIKLMIRKKPKISVNDEQLLFEIIKKSFTQRRKTLVNALINYKLVNNKDEATSILKKLNLSPDVRGETLSLETFAKLSDFISK